MGKLSDLEVNVEDVAEILARFDSGAIGSIHLDMVQQPRTRSCRIIGTAGTLTWDGSCGAVRLYSADEQAWVDLGAGDGEEDMYIAELRHFLDCVAEEREPAVTGEDGRRTVEIALAAKRSYLERRAVSL
jgi:predicted dehydrogenase